MHTGILTLQFLAPLDLISVGSRGCIQLSYVDRVNYVVSLVSLTSLLDRRSEDLGRRGDNRSTGYERIYYQYHFFCLALASQQHLGRLGGAFDRRQHHPLPAGLSLNFSSFNPGKLVDNQLRSSNKTYEFNRRSSSCTIMATRRRKFETAEIPPFSKLTERRSYGQ